MTPNDFGPIYAETTGGLLQGTFPVEPWNTGSNLIFLLLGIHIALLTRLNRKKYPLLVYSLPLLLIGWIGGTLYHGTRTSFIWLAMDFAPIGILATAAALAFWKQVTGRWGTAIPLFAVIAAGGRALPHVMPIERGARISLGYLLLGVSLLLPLGLYVWRNARNEFFSFACVTAAFFAAVVCRSIDRFLLLPMGTHFLWHLCGGISVWLLMLLVKRLSDLKKSDF